MKGEKEKTCKQKWRETMLKYMNDTKSQVSIMGPLSHCQSSYIDTQDFVVQGCTPMQERTIGIVIPAPLRVSAPF